MRPSPDEATEQDLVSVGVLRLRESIVSQLLVMNG